MPTGNILVQKADFIYLFLENILIYVVNIESFQS